MLALTGALTIGSNVMLDVDLNGMVNWAKGDTWRLFDWSGLGSLSGSFDTLELDAVLDGTEYSWDYSELYTAGTISIVVVPEPSRAILMLVAVGSLLVVRRRRSYF